MEFLLAHENAELAQRAFEILELHFGKESFNGLIFPSILPLADRKIGRCISRLRHQMSLRFFKHHLQVCISVLTTSIDDHRVGFNF
jgi:hypothetical protein